MKSNMMILAPLALLVWKATGVPTDALLERTTGSTGLPYPVKPMIWTGSVGAGPNITVEGTIQEVVSHLQKTEPEFDLAARIAALSKRNEVSARTPIWETCHPDPDEPYADLYAGVFGTIRPIEDAISYLKSTGGSCACDAHSCCRISCSYNDAVYLCNDNDYLIQGGCYYEGATMVQWINDNCAGVDSGHSDQIKGKIGDSQSYTITVQGNGNC